MELATQVVLILQTSVIALVLILLYYGVSFYLYVRRLEKIFKGAKGPDKYHWLLGSFKYFPPDTHGRLMLLVELANMYCKEQGYLFLWGPYRKPFITLCCPKLIGQICKSTEPKPLGFIGTYRFVQPWLGEGLLLASGSKWARNRRLLTPAFHFEILKPYTTVFNRSADSLVKKLSVKAETGERFEVFEYVCLCTLEIILKCAFSYNKDVQNAGDSNPYVKAVNRIADSVQYRFMNPLLLWDFLWYRCKVGKQFKEDCDFMHSVAEDIIDRRKETLNATDEILRQVLKLFLIHSGSKNYRSDEPTQYTEDQDKTGVDKEDRYIDFLDILLTAKDDEGRGLSRIEIRNEVDTFLFEGHDTTASAISWILYSLAENPECQQKCQMEIDEILEGRESDDLDWSDLSRLEFLTQCIKEGMRLHSPVPIVSREIENEFDLGDRVAPKGSIIQISIWVMNHMENLWGKDHWEFKPERFSKENINNIEHFQYVPFSAGPRNCIGQNFAMNEEKVVLSKLLRNFNFRLDKNHTVRRNLAMVMRAKDGIYLYAEKRPR